MLSDIKTPMAWKSATLPLGYRDNFLSVSNQLLNNKIYTKNKLQFSCSIFICDGAFFTNIVNVLRPLFSWKSSIVDVWQDSHVVLPNSLISARRKSEKKLPTTKVTQGNLGLLLLPNSPDLHQSNEMKSCADTAPSFPWVTPGMKTIKSRNKPGDI